jgi:hypothetical protein
LLKNCIQKWDIHCYAEKSSPYRQHLKHLGYLDTLIFDKLLDTLNISKGGEPRLPRLPPLATSLSADSYEGLLWGQGRRYYMQLQHCATLGDIRRHWQFSKKSSMCRWAKLGDIERHWAELGDIKRIHC